MITNLEHIPSAQRPFWRFSVLVELYGQVYPVGGFTYREGEGVTVPYMKYGKQGKEGKVRYLMPLSQAVINQIEEEVRAALAPANEWDERQASLLYTEDQESCRRLFPLYYRSLFIARSGQNHLFENLPEGRLWPDDVLRVWIAMTTSGVRDKEEFRADLERGLTSQSDYSRLLQMLEENDGHN